AKHSASTAIDWRGLQAAVSKLTSIMPNSSTYSATCSVAPVGLVNNTGKRSAWYFSNIARAATTAF
ncbi:MAG: hypothetical protein L0I62_03185, partial [Gammaproteobacteria bacterium]|nr:hypothetical protein [Gammaproteobacteria bacterium]